MARAPAVIEIEEVPEADRLEGFPHPRHTLRLFGHAAAERSLAEASESGRLHHAWLLSGAPGIGKATLAYRFATYLLARPEERDPLGASLEIAPEASASRLVRALSHPDLLLIRRPYDPKSKRHRTEITVDEVRRLKSFLSLTAEPGAWRVVIVDPADELNANAANALLKSLEEPPARCVFLLVCSAPGGLLPTIRSRCRTLAMEPLGGDVLRRAVEQAIAASGEEVSSAAAPEPSEWEMLERLSGGSVRRALALKAQGGLELNSRIEKLFDGLPRLDWEGVHKLSDEIASAAAAQRFELFFELFLGKITRLVRAGAGALPSGSGGGAEVALAQRLLGGSKLATWAELWETASRDKALAEALNLDRKALVLETMARVEAAARP